MSKKVENFIPRDGKDVKIFTCGPSIYQRAHIGNYRTFLYEDLLVRYLRYKDYSVVRAMNLTDIEDKAISEAKRKKTNVKALTDDVLAVFREGLDGFGFIMPEYLIPATESIEKSVDIIQELVKREIAYEYEGDYFFDPLKISDFGKLFKLDMGNWPKTRRRFKKDTYNGNRWNLGDFILWHNHQHDPDHPFWDTAIGRGRPSWNIQDPAIVTMSLGDYVDINCGGIDNIYRHHDYNIAIMEAYTGKTYANYYMHGEHLVVEGKSMSKSRGNIIYPEDIAKTRSDWKSLRFFLTYTHYRKKLNYTAEAFAGAGQKLNGFRDCLAAIKSGASGSPDAEVLIERIPAAFGEQLDNDLSLGKGFDAVFEIISKLRNLSETAPLSAEQLKKLNNYLMKIDNVLNVIYDHQ